MAAGGPDRSRDDASPRPGRPSLPRRSAHRATGRFDSVRVRAVLAAAGVAAVAATAFLVIHASSRPTNAAAITPSPTGRALVRGPASASASPTYRPSPAPIVTP